MSAHLKGPSWGEVFETTDAEPARISLAADPARRTVAGVACRWGFHSPSRFAVLYRQACGVLPSHTIHRN